MPQAPTTHSSRTNREESLRQVGAGLQNLLEKTRAEYVGIRRDAKDQIKEATKVTEPDKGNAIALPEVNMRRERLLRNQIVAIEAAIEKFKKFKAGGALFGICEECGEDISIRRLTHSPAVRLCCDCQAEMEENEKRGMR